MKADLAFLEAWQPEPVFLLGRELRPYCLAHDLALRRFRSAFLVPRRSKSKEQEQEQEQESTGATMEDLFFAVKVCSLDYREGYRWLRAPWDEWQAEFAEWGAECGTEKIQAGEEWPLLNTFLEYLLDGLKGPKPRPVLAMKIDLRGKPVQQNAGPKPGAPLDALLIWCLCGKLGFSLDDAMNFPLPAAKWLYCTALEQEGRLRLEAGSLLEQLREYAAEHGMTPIQLTPEQVATLKTTGSVEV